MHHRFVNAPSDFYICSNVYTETSDFDQPSIVKYLVNRLFSRNTLGKSAKRGGTMWDDDGDNDGEVGCGSPSSFAGFAVFKLLLLQTEIESICFGHMFRSI